MLFIKFVLFVAGTGLMAAAATIIAIDLAARSAVSRSSGPFKIRGHLAGAFVAAGCLSLLAALSIVVVPSGMAAVRVSQMMPMDGKFFFANDVLKGTPFGASLPHPGR